MYHVSSQGVDERMIKCTLLLLVVVLVVVVVV